MALYDDMVSDANDWKTQDSRKLYDYDVELEIEDGDDEYENTIESYSVKAYNEEEATDKALEEACNEYEAYDINVVNCSRN